MASSPEVNQWNEGWRSSPAYAEILQSVGVDPSRPFQLSDQQRKQVAQTIEQKLGMQFPDGVEIDPAGNMNENEGFGKQAKKWGPIVAAIAVTAFGIPGVMPGMLSGMGGAAGGAAGAMQSGQMVNGVLTGVGAGGAAGYAPAAAALAGGGSAAATGGALSKIGGMLGGKGTALLGAAGKMLGAGASGAAHNRGVQFDADIARAQLEQQAERDYSSATIAREEEGRAKQGNAWEMMNRAAYVQDAPTNLNKTNLSTYSKPLAGPNEGQRTAATGMFEQMSKQLAEGNTMEMPRRVGTDVSIKQPGLFEKWGGMIAPGLTAWDRLNQEPK